MERVASTREESNAILEAAGKALRAGEITKNEFVRRTADRWRRTSQHLYSRWRRKLPQWVEREDVEQELVLLALEYVTKWTPGRGASLPSYVLWCSIHRAQRKMDHWRGASLSGNSGKNPGRHELTFSRIASPDGDDPGTRVPGENDDPLDLIESGEEFEVAMARCQTVRQALVMLALRATRGDVERAAWSLHRNFRSRLECDIESVEHAEEVIREVVEEMSGIFRGTEKVSPPEDLFDDAASLGA
jgi:hypothetical protein